MQSTKLVSLEEIKEIASALSSDLRINMLRLLSQGELSLNELSRELSIPLSTATANIKQLEDAGIVRCEMRPAKRGLKKVCIKSYDSISLRLTDENMLEKSNTVIQDMPIGRFSDFQVEPTCGLASAAGIISYVDDPVSFYDPESSEAQIIWFTCGYLEYRFPNRLPSNAVITSLEVSMEVCSEAPGYNSSWPSDIFVEINNTLLGIFTSPADFGDKRGLLNPAWWDSNLTQYGQHKRWIVTPKGCYVDGVNISRINISDLHLAEGNSIKVRIGVKPDAKNMGGINIFGRKFGNYEQDIRLKIEYE